jgi:hypothetical protein
MSNFKLKATHAPVKAYYETLERFGRGKFDNEGNIRRAFEALLEKCARGYEWFLVAEYPIPRTGPEPAEGGRGGAGCLQFAARVLGGEGREGRPEGGDE